MTTYKYDLHVHTSEVSPCGKVKAEDVIKLYKSAGYEGIVVTDHYYDGYFESLTDMSWKEKADCFLEGYRKALNEGRKTGLKVLPGMEIRFTENWNDYLIYGIDEDFIYNYPELYKLDLLHFREFINHAGRKNIMIFQAHPFRAGIVAADPSLLDGVEVYNGNPRQNSFNEKAEAYASRYNLIAISGSDFHQPQDIARGGILLTKAVETSAELAAALKYGMVSELIRT